MSIDAAVKDVRDGKKGAEASLRAAIADEVRSAVRVAVEDERARVLEIVRSESGGRPGYVVATAIERAIVARGA